MSDAYTTGNGTATLTLTNPPHTWNGSIYRLRLVNTDGLTTYSENRTLVCLPSYLYVKQTGSGTKDGTSWANAMPSTDLQHAMHLAAPYTQVWIAGGTYPLASTVPASGSEIYGGFAGTETSLSQRVKGTNETRMVSTTLQRMITFYGTASYPATPVPIEIPTVLDRLTLVGLSYGSAALVRLQDADVRMSDVEVKDSYPVSISIGRGTVELSGCTVSGGGDVAVDARDAAVTIRKSTFSSNGNRGAGALAGAIYSSGSTISIEDSSFAQNRGLVAGAIYTRDGGSVEIRRSRFLENTGSGGSGGALSIRSTGPSKISNSLFTGNVSTMVSNQGSGGAINARNCSIELSQLTLVGNRAPTYGGAVHVESGSATLVNSIVSANVSNGGWLSGNISQSGNFEGPYDPLFDAGSADLALSSHSPLRDLGGNSAAVSGATDLSGSNRFFGGVADLGASEFSGTAGEKVYLFERPTDKEVFVERPVSFSIRAAAGNPSSGTPVVWQFRDGSTWKPLAGVDGWTTTLTNGTSTLANPGVTQVMNGLQIRAHFSAVPDLSIPVKLTVKPRLILYVDGSLAASGNGKTWPTAFITIREALAIATLDTDIWVAGGDYAEADLVPPAGARIFIGFAGGESDLAQRDPVANPVRIGAPISDRTIIEGDTTVLVPPLPLAAGQTARWQVKRGAGMVDLSADANHALNEVRGIPGLAILGSTALSGQVYQVVYTTGAVVDYVSLPAVITVIPRPVVYVDAAVTGGADNGSNWANAFSDLSAALAAYPAFSDFKIAAGTYRAGSGGFVIRRGTVLRGGYLAGSETRDPVVHRTLLTSAN
ncbi:MAG: right-handed parallel beta-helix repeat-containing protein, partial [Verrucomicrobiaceae bacterium]